MSLNTEEFLNMSTDTALDTVIEPCPEGEHLAQIGDISVADFVFKSGAREGEKGYRMVIPWEIQSDEVKEKLGRDKVQVTQSLLLDMNDDNSGLDMSKGKNVGLGRLREALGQNEPGKPWSPAMLNGQIATIEVSHDLYNGNIVAQFKAVRPA